MKKSMARFEPGSPLSDELPARVLPVLHQPWVLGNPEMPRDAALLEQAVELSARRKDWRFPRRPVHFVTDPHADAEAFVASLQATGGILRDSERPGGYRLTRAGEQARFIIGGDCLDKGPSNLDLLRAVAALRDTGARLVLLAGNHDIRLLVGLRSLHEHGNTATEHLFIRMGPKVVPLLAEVHGAYLRGSASLKGIPGARACRKRLYPSEHWFERFPKAVDGLMPAPAIAREMARMRKKVDHFEEACAEAGLSLRDVYATALQCEKMFLRKSGEFGWFFRDMQLAHREGSFLFIHAGIDDQIARMIRNGGVRRLNRQFRKQVRRDLFAFYYGPVANCMRTKYRDVDLRLTGKGVRRVWKRGYHAVAHGHRNRINGQRLMLREGMIHLECDITLDAHSRIKDGASGAGAGVTTFLPDGRVIGVSTDHPYAKVFAPISMMGKHPG